MNNFVILPHLEIQNANALSSPFTIGFPAMTAWMGAIHLLERYLRKDFNSLKIIKMGIVSHEFHLHTYKEKGGYNYSIIGTKNPPKVSGQKIESPPFIPEPRCNLEISLILKIENYNPSPFEREDTLIDTIKRILPRMKFASGDLLPLQKNPELKYASDSDMEEKIKNNLMPGYALRERRDILKKEMEKGQDGLNALLEGVKVEHYWDKKEKKMASEKKK